MDDHLESERAEPPVGDARTALADAATLVVAVRDDGRVAVVEGLPDGIDVDSLDAPVLVSDGARPVVAVFVDRQRDDEAVALLGRFRDDRAALLSLEDPGLALGALGFGHWRARTRFCPRCGGRLVARPDGRALDCPACGSEHFPRLEPAVIVRVVDADDRILLGRQPGWPPGRFSVLAGFVDPGESVEAAIRREVMEEVGIVVGDVEYVASQPWPFPASLMLGCAARAETTDVVLTDDEIAEARWYDRDGLREAMATGEVFVPPNVSIAHRLVVEWFGAEVRTWLDAD